MPASPEAFPIVQGRCVIDVTRLAQRQRSGLKRPSGIDRLNLQYARRGRELFGGQCLAVEGSRFGARPLSSKALDALLAHWPEDGAPSSAPMFAPSLGVFTPRTDDLYFHTGHLGLEWSATARLLEFYRDRAAVYLHDILPLSHPEYFRAQDRKLHSRRVASALAFGAKIIVNSDATAESVNAYAASQGLAQRPIFVAPTPVEPIFASVRARRTPEARPYFVALGTIEPRKNHALLFDAWRTLTERHGGETPELVCVGRLGWGRMAKQFSALCESQPHIRWAQSISDTEVVALLSGACALLAPSFAEGMGLPLAEARVMGLPIIASDIPAHRETGGADAIFLDPNDAPAWADAVDAFKR